MTDKIYLFIFVLFSISMSACATSQASSQYEEEVVFDDRTVSAGTNEIKFSDTELNGKSLQRASGGQKSEEQTVSGEDNSKITTMTDSFGNKTEMRCFNNHPRVDCVAVETSSDGKRRATVYPTVKGAKILPEDMTDRALTASADELANVVGAHETRASQTDKSVSPYAAGQNKEALRPLPSYTFPVQLPQNAPVPAETTAAPTEQPTENSSSDSEETQAPATEKPLPNEQK